MGPQKLRSKAVTNKYQAKIQLKEPSIRKYQDKIQFKVPSISKYQTRRSTPMDHLVAHCRTHTSPLIKDLALMELMKPL